MKLHAVLCLSFFSFAISCLHNYRDPKTVIPDVESNRIEYKSNFDAGDLKNPGKLKQNETALIHINGQYLYKNPTKNDSSGLCILSALTLTVIPCMQKGAEVMELEVSAPDVTKKIYKINNEVENETYVWLPLLLISPFFGDSKPDRGIAISMHEKYTEILQKINDLNKDIAKLIANIKKLKANPAKYPVLLTDFTSYGYALEGGGHVNVKIYNNSRKVITKTVYEIVPGNFIGATSGDKKTLTNNERIGPGNFSKKTFFKNANPRTMMGKIYMESVVVTYEDGSTYTLPGSKVRDVSVLAPDNVIRNPE